MRPCLYLQDVAAKDGNLNSMRRGTVIIGSQGSSVHCPTHTASSPFRLAPVIPSHPNLVKLEEVLSLPLFWCWFPVSQIKAGCLGGFLGDKKEENGQNFWRRLGVKSPNQPKVLVNVCRLQSVDVFSPSDSCPCLFDCCMCAGLNPSHSHAPMAAVSFALNKQRPH